MFVIYQSLDQYRIKNEVSSDIGCTVYNLLNACELFLSKTALQQTCEYYQARLFQILSKQ